MTNKKWIQHVKDYAKRHNLSYACALSQPDIKDGYSKEKSRKERKIEKEQEAKNQFFIYFKNKIKNMDKYNKPILQNKYKTLAPDIKERIKNTKYYNLLFS